GREPAARAEGHPDVAARQRGDLRGCRPSGWPLLEDPAAAGARGAQVRVEEAEEIAPGLAAVAEDVFLGAGELAEGAVLAFGTEDGVPAEAVVAAGGEDQ